MTYCAICALYVYNHNLAANKNSVFRAKLRATCVCYLALVWPALPRTDKSGDCFGCLQAFAALG